MAEAAETIDGEATEVTEPDEPATQVVPITRPAAQLAVTPDVSADDLVKRLDVIKQASETAMQENIDYGEIPGTNKPTLLKPGAEKLGVLFQLDVQLENEKTWDGDHLTVISHATVFHAPTGSRLGYGEGVCTTKERKYAYRKPNRTCPTCGAEAIIKGKAEYGGGWLCWKKRDGCGAKFPDGAEAIESQDVGEIPNPDLPDLWNTVVKMAEKRARVDAVLAVTGASALFTQDVEDTQAPADEPAADSTSLVWASVPELEAAKKALGRLVAGGKRPIPEAAKQRALTIWTEVLGLSADRCPKGVAVLLMRLDPEPPAQETTDPAPDDADLPEAA